MNLSPIPILILRLAVAILFIHLGYTKISSGWLSNSEPLKKSLVNFEQNAPSATKWYLDNVAKPGVDLWSKLIPLGETALGISLLLGLLVRLSTFVGILMVLNFHLTIGTLLSLNFFGSAWAIPLVASLIVLNLTKAGRGYGVDSLLAKRKSKSVLY